jgi:hypothetical protein
MKQFFMPVLTSTYFNYTGNTSVICALWLFSPSLSETSDTALDASGQHNSHRTQHI